MQEESTKKEERKNSLYSPDVAAWG